MSEQFGIKPPYFENEGALHFSRGKFILSMSGVKNNKKISERTRSIVIIAVIAAVVVLLAGATLLAGHQPNSLPYEYKLRSSIGQTIETVVQNLEIKMEDVEQVSPGVYSVKDGCKLSGVPFEIKLNFSEDGLLNGFEYLSEYAASANEAAYDLYKILLDLRFDKKPELLEGIKLTPGGLKEYFRNNTLSVQSTSDWSPTYTEDAAYKYLRQLEASETWEGRVGDYVTKSAMLYEDTEVRYTPDDKTVYIQIIHVIEPDRSKN